MNISNQAYNQISGKRGATKRIYNKQKTVFPKKMPVLMAKVVFLVILFFEGMDVNAPRVSPFQPVYRPDTGFCLRILLKTHTTRQRKAI